MKTTTILTILLVTFGLMVCSTNVSGIIPSWTVFTYQGRLIDANTAADGLYDFQFELYDSPSNGNQLGSAININELDVTDGYFTVELNFGSVFDGNDRWLEIGVRLGELEDTNNYTVLIPRQQVTPTPYALYAMTVENDNDWIISGNKMYSGVSGNVGIGLSSPDKKLTVIGTIKGSNPSTDNLSIGVVGEATGASGFTFGVWGESTSPDGTGVYGVTLANSGTTYGVYGLSNSPAGTGVYGEVSDTGVGTSKGGHFKSGTSTGRGVYGEATGSGGRGVYGSATNTGDSTNYGGYFTAEGTYGRGVYALVSGTDGRGVYGYASNTEDVENYGGYFRASGMRGRGVYGYASSTGDVENYGGYFWARGERGRGVYGYASNTGDVANYGGYFEAEGVWGMGVYGKATGEIGEGIWAEATGSVGVGVWAVATGGNGMGVHSKALGTNGIAVFGNGEDYDFYAAGPGTNYGAPSSIRWKRDIQVIDKPMEKVMQLRGVYFNWDAEHGGQHDVGMVAEEVGNVLPEIVNYEPDGQYTSGMDYSKLTPLLVEAVKELKAENDDLKQRLEKLEEILQQSQLTFAREVR